MCMLGWLGGNADPDNFLYGLLSADTAKTPGAANVAIWKNAEFTDLCLKGQKTFDKAERTKLYLKAQEIFHAEAPWVPLAHSTIVRCYSKKLHDVPLAAERAELVPDGPEGEVTACGEVPISALRLRPVAPRRHPTVRRRWRGASAPSPRSRSSAADPF